MYGVLSTQRGARIVPVPRLGAEQGFALDVDAVIARLPEVQVVWLCAPNNPTGAPEPLATIETILRATRPLGTDAPIVVVDEAYAEFWHETAIPLRAEYPNLVVIRTLSKAFALPGHPRRVRRGGTADHRTAGARPAAGEHRHDLRGARDGGPGAP